MAATAMSNPNNRSNVAQAWVELGNDLLSIVRPRSSMGATVSEQSIGQRAGGVSEADRTMIAVIAGLNGKHARAMDGQIQRAAELGAQAAKEAGHKGALSEEQAKAISDQVMMGVEGKHLGAHVQEKSRLVKSKAAFIGTLGAAVALTTGALALAAKPLAWAGDKIMGTKVSESFTVRGAVTKGFLATAAVFGAAAVYDMHKRNSRNNARQAALVHAIQHGARSHAEGRFVTRAEAAAAAPKVEPALAPEAARQEQEVTGVTSPAPKPTVAVAAVPVPAAPTPAAAASKPVIPSAASLIPAAATAIPAVKTVATVAATAEKVAAAIKPDFGASNKGYASVTYGGDVKLGTGGAIPGKTPEIPGAKAETTRG